MTRVGGDKECIENVLGKTSWKMSVSKIEMGMETNIKTLRWVCMQTNIKTLRWVCMQTNIKSLRWVCMQTNIKMGLRRTG
jgi:hypothetical protein